MALKPDYIANEKSQDIRNYCFNVSEKGGVMCSVTAGSGGYPGNVNNVAAYVQNPSGSQPLGILLVDVVAINQTQQHLNFYKVQAESGSKVVLSRGGCYTTNLITGTIASAPLNAYLHSGGNISTTQLSGAPQIGRFLTTLDEDGYAFVEYKI